MTAHPKPRGAPRKYPFYSMKIGDSLFVPNRRTTDLSSSIRYVQDRMNWVFTTATAVERKTTGVLVKRVG